jgi:ornithine carbamoyltransferase
MGLTDSSAKYQPEANLAGRDLLSIADLNREEIEAVFELALAFKQDRIPPTTQRRIAEGKTLALIFDKASLRTRVSFEAAIWNLGGQAVYLAPGDLRMGEREPVKDVARTLSRMVDGIAGRLSSDSIMAELAEWASVPVINAMTNLEHPCQALADLLTVKEHKRSLPGLRLAFVGDGFNVCHSLLLICPILGVNIAVAAPAGYEPKPEIVKKAKGLACESTVETFSDAEAALRAADVVCTDVWVSGGLEAEAERRRQDFAGFQVDGKRLSLAKKDAIILHCLPAHRGEEITEEVLEGPQAVVFDEAENRLWAQQALLALVLGSPDKGKIKRGRQ